MCLEETKGKGDVLSTSDLLPQFNTTSWCDRRKFDFPCVNSKGLGYLQSLLLYAWGWIVQGVGSWDAGLWEIQHLLASGGWTSNLHSEPSQPFPARLAPLPYFFGSLHFYFLPTPAIFSLCFSSLGNTLALSDFLLHSGDTPSVYFSQRARCQSHQHIQGVLRENPGSSDLSAHRYAEARMGGSLWRPLWYYFH